MKKHIFFDMDGTLTPSRQTIEPNMEGLLSILHQYCDIVIVSGAQDDQMAVQIPRGIFPAFRLSQNGNVAVSPNKRCPLWKNELNWIQKRKVFDLVCKILKETDTEPFPDLVEDRGSQISYSATGHHAPLEEKRAYDPSGSHRGFLMRNTFRKEFEYLRGTKGVQASIGGTTCIDFYIHSKGENVAKLVGEMGWIPTECLYIGDALFEGGNDATVKGVIETRQVRDHKECERVVLELLAKV